VTDIEAIKGRLAAATPGPWYVDESLRGVEAQTHGYPVEIVGWTGRAEAMLIAHAPSDIAALVAEVGLLQQEARVQRAISDGLAAELEHLRATVAALRASVPPSHPSDYGLEVWSAALVEAK